MILLKGVYGKLRGHSLADRVTKIPIICIFEDTSDNDIYGRACVVGGASRGNLEVWRVGHGVEELGHADVVVVLGVMANVAVWMATKVLPEDRNHVSLTLDLCFDDGG